MKLNKIWIVALFLFNFSAAQFTQLIKLNDKWQFKTGDDSSYKEINYNDNSWDQIFVTAQWEEQGSNYGGAIPMVGFGAGAYILALCDYYMK